MKIWLIEISDFILSIDNDNRIFRAGMLAKALLEKKHDVVWWSSTFNHQLRKQRFTKSTVIDVSNNFQVRLLFGYGYKNSISLSRLRHIRSVAHNFLIEINKIKSNNHPDLIYSCVPTLELSEYAIQFGKRNNIPVVIDVRDQWPEFYLTVFPRNFRWALRVILRSEFNRAKNIFNNAQSIIGISKTNLNWALSLAGRVQSKHDCFFPLGASEMEGNKAIGFLNRLSSKINENYFVVTFVGTFSNSFNFRTVIRTAEHFSQISDSEIVFVFVGDGVQFPVIEKLSKKLNNIFLLGWCEKEEMRQILTISDAGIAPYKTGIPITLPNKIFEYMSFGLPIISSLDGESRYMINYENIGLYYDANNEKELIDSINWLRANSQERDLIKARTKSLFTKLYNSKTIYENMVSHLEVVANEYN